MTAGKSVCSFSLLVLGANRFLKDQCCLIGLCDMLRAYNTLQSKKHFLKYKWTFHIKPKFLLFCGSSFIFFI